MDHTKAENLLNELFNGFKPIGGKVNFEKQYNEYVESVNYLGLHHDKNSRENLAIYVVKLKKNSSRDRARVMQRNLIGMLLDQYKRDAGLVAFYSEDQEDWRFSFVKVDYEIDSETINVKKTFSSAKRFSYLTGPYEPNHSCKSRFLKFLIDEEQIITISQIQEIFSVEKVTNEFFEKYNELFKKLKESLDEVIKTDEIVKEEFEKCSIESSDFSKKLLGQIVFIYFLQKKGWLGVDYDGKWGEGSKNFFKETLQFYKKNKDKFTNFFDDIVEPFFYKGLNVIRDRDYYEDLNCKIPFLNGGLFEPINDYNWVRTKILLDDSIFEEIIKTFDRFNFTVKENEPLEKEVAIDPEMLGKVFENLLESDARKQKGAFYTPREIVQYICQKTLINYLNSNSEVPEDTITHFIEKGYKLIDYIIRYQEELKVSKEKEIKHIHLNHILKHSDKLKQLLVDVKVVDPAVGSGAFPVGMMNEIVNAKTILKLLNNENNEEPDTYKIKKETIENSLYGVDIEYSALEIAKLRFWISLIVDEESTDYIRPLPNLDHKLMCGNSLIDELLISDNESIPLFDKTLLKRGSSQTTLDRFHKESQTILEDLRRLQKRFFNEENPNKKRDLRNEIDDKEWSLIEATLKERGDEEKIKQLEENKKINSKPFFIWELYFSEIFQKENPGFDIVIGNPPYIFNRDRKITNEEKKYYTNNFKLSEYQTNTYILFTELSHKILKNCGSLGFIVPNNWLTINTTVNFRKFVLSSTGDLIIINSKDKIFESANIDSSILIFSKSKPTNILLFLLENKKLSQIGVFQYENFKNSDYIINFNLLEGNEIQNLMSKIESQSAMLGEISKVSTGLKAYQTGKGNPKQTDKMKNNRIYHSFEKIDDSYLPYLDGKSVGRYSLVWFGEYLKYGINLAEQRKSVPFDKPRILIRQIPSKPPYSINAIHNDEIFLNDINSMVVFNNDQKHDLKFILGLLNSKLITFWFINKFDKLQRKTFPQFKVNELKKFPIVSISDIESKNNLMENVNIIEKINKELLDEISSFSQILSKNQIKTNKKLNSFFDLTFDDFFKEIKKQSKSINEELSCQNFNKSVEIIKLLQLKINDLNNEIDKIVYDLYNLTDDEIKIIENFEQ